jgi:Zn-finger nucleic acid-binding protein
VTESPYRELPRVLMCPRCGDVLERVVDGVWTCTRCEGVWLTNAMIDRAFGTQRWPGGASAWWRREVDCPACAGAGEQDAMTPMLVGDLLVDRCSKHGIWLDHSELGRLIGAPSVVEVEALYRRLRPDEELPEAIVEYRKRRAAELGRRARELEEYRAKLAAEQARIAEEQATEQRKRIAELRAAERKRLDELRAVAGQEVTAAEKELVALRAHVRTAEGKLADARARLLETDRQIDALDAAAVT